MIVFIHHEDSGTAWILGLEEITVFANTVFCSEEFFCLRKIQKIGGRFFEYQREIYGC